MCYSHRFVFLALFSYSFDFSKLIPKGTRLITVRYRKCPKTTKHHTKAKDDVSENIVVKIVSVNGIRQILGQTQPKCVRIVNLECFQ